MINGIKLKKSLSQPVQPAIRTRIGSKLYPTHGLLGIPSYFAQFSRPQLAQLLLEQTDKDIVYSHHYLLVVLRQMGSHYYKPRPCSVRRPVEAKAALIERVRATFDGLQALGYNLDRVAFGFADESSPQLSANTDRLWSLGKVDRVFNTDKRRANTFGFFGHTRPRLLSVFREFIGAILY